MAHRRRLVAETVAAAFAVGGVATAATVGVPVNPFGSNQVGKQQADGRILLPDNHWISPYGQRAATFSAQTIGIAISPDGTKIAAQTGGDNSGTPQLSILDAATGSVLQRFGGSGVAAPVYSPDGSTLYAATLTSILKYTVDANGGNRGGTPITSNAGSGKGAGDDWACTITDLRASDGAGPTMLDVTLKANGCYQVQSPPGAVGALYITNPRGKTFINPLYAFDGCFGTL